MLDLKEGTYVRWVADRRFKAWDTLGVVTKVLKDNVTIFTYDDNKNTTINLRGEAIKSGEITIVDKLDVKTEFQNKILFCQQKINELNTKIEKFDNIIKTIV